MRFRQPLPVVAMLAALSPGPAAQGEAPAPPNDLESRRRRAEKLRPRLMALEDRFEAHTFDAGEGKRIPYRLFKAAREDGQTKLPLVVFLHGAGGRGTDNGKQVGGGNLLGARVWALPENQKERPGYVLAPQVTEALATPRTLAVRGEKKGGGDDSPAGEWSLRVRMLGRERRARLALRREGETWQGSVRVGARDESSLTDVSFKNGCLTFQASGAISLRGELTIEGRQLTGELVTVGNRERAARVMDLIRAIIEKFPIDSDRIYITGQSMGGAGTWGMLSFHPDAFAAAVPVCGSGDVAFAPAIVAGGAAVWAFHGDADPVVSVDGSRRMIAALRAAGGHPRYTELPGVKHDAWTYAYLDADMHRWLFQQKRGH